MTFSTAPTLVDLDAEGDRYQTIFRVLDLAMDAPNGTIYERLASIPPDAFASVSRIASMAEPSEGFTCVGHRLVHHALQIPGGEDHRGEYSATSALVFKRLLLAEYVALLDQRRRLSQARTVGAREAARIQSGILEGALSVIPMNARSPSAFYQADDRIVRAAVLYKDRVWSKPAPFRHFNIINEMFDVLGGVIDAPQIDGFVTAAGDFVEREEAKRIAKVLRQTFLVETHPRELFSEDLW